MMAICNTKESYNEKVIASFIQAVKQVRPLLQPGRHITNRFIYIMIVCRYMAVHDYKIFKRIVACFHAGDYEEAYQLYRAHKKQPSSFSMIKEYWNIIKGYIYVLKNIGLISPEPQEHFRLGKFINEVPMYSKDKAGLNINILIIQIIVQMKRGQYVSIIDRMDSLQEYVRTYTKNSESKRANIFIRMVLKMGIAQFHRTGTENKIISSLLIPKFLEKR